MNHNLGDDGYDEMRVGWDDNRLRLRHIDFVEGWDEILQPCRQHKATSSTVAYLAEDTTI